MQIDNLVKPAGWIALGFHFGALFVHIFVFGTWANSAVKKAPDDPSDAEAGAEAGAEAAVPPTPPRPAPDEQAVDDAIAEMRQRSDNPVAGAQEEETEET